VRRPFEVYLNGVAQKEGVDYVVSEGDLVFSARLEREKVGRARWTSMFLGIAGSYGKDDSVASESDADTDSDTIQEGLELANGLKPNDSTDAWKVLDGDVFTNWHEFIAGTHRERASHRATGGSRFCASDRFQNSYRKKPSR
jgi:hypothetical protein